MAKTPGCYAAPLEDCRGPLSAEHYISRNILQRLNQSAPNDSTAGASTLQVAGLPFLEEGEFRSLPPNALTNKVLCERHNNALSTLDAAVGRLFEAIDLMDGELGVQSIVPHNSVHLINGHDVERWALKVLFGLPTNHGAIISERHLVTLFSPSGFERPEGLYVSIQKGPIASVPRGLQIRTITPRDRNQVVGCEVHLNGIAFILLLEPTDTRLVSGAAFRPLEILLEDGRCEKSILFHWDRPGDGGTLKIHSERKAG